jgi:hypothetical protein
MNIRYVTQPFVLMLGETAAGNSTMDTAIGGVSVMPPVLLLKTWPVVVKAQLLRGFWGSDWRGVQLICRQHSCCLNRKTLAI